MDQFADPLEVVNPVLYLASDESCYAAGGEFLVDGGLVSGIPHKQG